MSPLKNQIKNELDAVLAAFLRESTDPTPEQIARWKKLHPQYAAEIMGLAADLIELSMEEPNDPVFEATDQELIQLRPDFKEFQETLRGYERSAGDSPRQNCLQRPKA